jgi:dGTPase
MDGSELEILAGIQAHLDRQESQRLSPKAAKSPSGQRRRAEKRLEAGYRQSFSVDADRILHSLAYTRYIDKTQVFYLIENDHITHRVLHVQLVSKIARTIGRFLGLNEDLIEAIALGHDIGHTPFGHDGERFLSDICKAHGIGTFQHNLQSVQFLDRVERKGRGWNLCLQTLDGILCHDGEIHNQQLAPQPSKTFADLDAQLTQKKQDPGLALTPMTLEGCVVRMADTVSYIGRDLEDAIRLELIKRCEIPRSCTAVLGDTNGTIVYHLVTDIIAGSCDQPFIAFSPQVSTALQQLKAFNMERIYLNPIIKPHSGIIRELFETLFAQYLADLENEAMDSVIFSHFLQDMAPSYIDAHRPAEVVRDFIAGMTDRYFLRQCPAGLKARLHPLP